MARSSSSPLVRLGILTVVIVLVVAGGTYWWLTPSRGLPEPGSDAYEQVTRRFYRGMAGLQVGLTESAQQEFRQATSLVPAEPASWANLGLAHLRLGQFDEAAAAMGQAASLAPRNGEIAYLQGRLEGARGNPDAGVAHLRRALELAPGNVIARTALAQELENAGTPDAEAEAQRLVDGLAPLAPGNLSVTVERARLAAKRGDLDRLRAAVGELVPASAGWPAEVTEEFRAVQQATAAGNLADAARAMAFLRNVLARVPEYLESRRAITPSAELIADPLPQFLRLAAPTATPAPADTAIAFAANAVGTLDTSRAWRTLVSFTVGDEDKPAVFVADGREIRRADAVAPVVAFPGGPNAEPPSAHGLLALDWNHDFRMDLVAVGDGGLRIFLQTESGAFRDVTSTSSAGAPVPTGDSVWAADVEMDGDLDIVLGGVSGTPAVLRNNGDGSWRVVQPFAGLSGLRGFAWGDIDTDGDPDAAAVDGRGSIHVFLNLQAGEFSRMAGTVEESAAAIALGDVNGDGVFDVVSADRSGSIRRASLTHGTWERTTLATGPAVPDGAAVTLLLADVDNNGALDLLTSTSGETTVWLATEDLSFQPLPAPIPSATWAVTDVDGGGQLDLVGLSNGAPVAAIGRGTKGYHFHVVRPRAQSAAGDQRINSFGIGGDVEVRAGRLVQKQAIVGQTVHVGLGSRTAVDVTRIVWPNGVPQAEFDPGIDRIIVAEQRLKGSCPWIFADDGTGMRFVTDFLWRSPLGLRINASDTAGVTQTEDWVKIRGNQLVPRNGLYDLRISAELWETHFVDHVSLMVVDHPADTDVFVDERFVPVAPPALAVHNMSHPEPVAHAWDQSGQDVTDVVSARDGKFLATFRRGRYQGVADDHYVEFNLARPLDPGVSTWLVAYGWIYPTDSSINVAIGQGQSVVPKGLSLEALDARGQWMVVEPNLGFPAGKNKTVLIDLGSAARQGITGAQRFRLRTNLEIYWDALETAVARPADTIKTQRLASSKAELRYRGFSVTETSRREEPETPTYSRLATTTPRWRDLVGYYTRYGDVRELLAAVEDRYVIMNAGDELRLSFAAPPPPPAGWTRDFVLVGDGWVKDGDFNTSYAKTVLPLPEHRRADYTAESVTPVLERDPVYRRHAADWQTFHTRYVVPQPFLDGLRAPDRRAAR